MSEQDQPITASDYLNAETVLSHLSHNLAIQFQIEGMEWDRETMQKHVNARSAISIVQLLLIDEAERMTAP